MDDFKAIVDLICKYKARKYETKNGIIYRDQEIQFERARTLFDETFCKKEFDKVKAYYYNKCSECGSMEMVQIHHIDFNHFNNCRKNLSVICWGCHSKLHRTSTYQGKKRKAQLLTYTQSAQYMEVRIQTIYNWINSGKIQVYFARDDTPYLSHQELLDVMTVKRLPDL